MGIVQDHLHILQHWHCPEHHTSLLIPQNNCLCIAKIIFQSGSRKTHQCRQVLWGFSYQNLSPLLVFVRSDISAAFMTEPLTDQQLDFLQNFPETIICIKPLVGTDERGQTSGRRRRGRRGKKTTIISKMEEENETRSRRGKQRRGGIHFV